MEVARKKLENQVQFWSLLGPFFVLLSISVLIIKVSPHWYFPLSALIGIPLCLKWKMKGMAAALGCLFVLSGVSYINLDFDDRYWHVGLSLAMAFSFIVLTLSLEEAQGLIGKLELESKSRMDNFLLLDEKWNAAELVWKCEREKTLGKIAALTSETERIADEKQTFYKLAQLAKDELVQVRGQHDLLLQDLLYKKEQISQLRERLDEADMTIQGFVDTDSEKRNAALATRIAELEREKEKALENIEEVQKLRRACQAANEHLQSQVQAFLESEKDLMLEKQNSLSHLHALDSSFQALQKKCESLESDRENLIASQKLSQTEADALRLTLQRSQEELDRSRGEVEAKREALIQVQCTLDQLSEEWLQQQSFLEQCNAREKVKAAEADALRLTLQKSQEELDRTRGEVEAKREALIKVQGTLDQLSEEWLRQQSFLEQCNAREKEMEAEAHVLRVNLQRAQEELDGARGDAQEKQGALVQVQSTLDQLSEELLRQQSFLEQCNAREKEKEAEANALRLTLKRSQEELETAKEEAEEKCEKLVSMQSSLDQFSQELSIQKALLEQSGDRNKELESLTVKLEEIASKAQAAKPQKEMRMERRSFLEKLPYAQGNHRQIEAMYVQLKGQFQEKSSLLDATRRELFIANEQLLKLQMDVAEDKTFGQSENERLLLRHIDSIGERLQEMQEFYTQEIEVLEQLVGSLLSQIE